MKCTHDFYSPTIDGCPYCKAEAFKLQAAKSVEFFRYYGEKNVSTLKDATVEEMYKAFATRFAIDLNEYLQPEFKRLHDLAINAFNSGARR